MSSKYNIKKRKKLPIGGALIGAGVGIATNLIQAHQQRKAQEEAERAQAEALRKQQFQDASSQAQLYNQMFNVEGLQATAQEGIALGGNPGNITKGGLERVSPEVSMLKGEPHENGGIDIDADLDGFSEYEVEGDEALYENMVFSKRKKTSKEAGEYLEAEGFKSLKGKTYAETVEELGKLQEKYQEKLESEDPWSRNTGELMLDRIDSVLQSLFMYQEEDKKE